MKITLRDNLLFREDFLSTSKENELSKINRILGGTARKVFIPFNFREIEHLQILHLVNI